MEKIDFSKPSFWDFKGQAEYSDQLFLMSTPFSIVLILVTYLWFVLKFGPEFMAKRKPFQFTNLMVVYNAVLVVLSAYLFYIGFKALCHYGLWNATCYCENDDINRKIIDASYIYFICKVVELLDTVFFVLRKKDRQVTFLHVYHHTLMCISCWLIVKYNRTDAVLFLGTINSFVHIVMYGYYALSVYPQLAKYLWWKRYITIMQLIQFIMMFVHIVVSHAVSECKPAYVLLFAVCTNTILFLYLFGDFYVKSYTKSNEIKNEGSEINNKRNEISATKNESDEISASNYKNEEINDADFSISNEANTKNGLNYLMNHSKLAAKIN